MESEGYIQGLLCAMPTGAQQCSTHTHGWQQAGKWGIPAETSLFLTTFVPCFPASFSPLHIPGVVTPPRLAKGKEVEVPIYLFGKVLSCFKPFFFFFNI